MLDNLIGRESFVGEYFTRKQHEGKEKDSEGNPLPRIPSNVARLKKWFVENDMDRFNGFHEELERCESFSGEYRVTDGSFEARVRLSSPLIPGSVPPTIQPKVEIKYSPANYNLPRPIYKALKSCGFEIESIG